MADTSFSPEYTMNEIYTISEEQEVKLRGDINQVQGTRDLVGVHCNETF